MNSGTRRAAFRDAIRDRNRWCFITGEYAVNAQGSWAGFEAAHIFPLAYGGDWNEHNYDRWTTIPPHTESAGSINSVQNGMLLNALFDSYDVSINPDDNYKLVCFNTDRKGIAGRHPDQQCLEDPRRPVDRLLRRHFRQVVLTNM